MATTCPECGDEKDRISQHWAKSSCDYPEIPSDLRAVLDGLVLAGGTIAGNGSNRHLTIGTTNADLADWTASELNWLHHGTRETETDDDSRDSVYRIRTPAHPGLNRYERWPRAPDSRGRIPPDRFSLSARTARVWHAFAGSLLFREYDSQRSATFSAKYDDRAEWIQRVLADVEFDATRAGKRVQLPPTETARWLSWIGAPVPGVEHKWRVSNVGERPVWKDVSQYPPRFPDQALVNALRNVADLFGRPPSINEFDDWRPPAYPTYVPIRRRWEGGWRGALDEAGLDVADLLRATRGKSARYPPELLRAAVREADAAVNGQLTVYKYRKWRERERRRGRVIPEVSTIFRRFGGHWWEIVEAAVDEESTD